MTQITDADLILALNDYSRSTGLSIEVLLAIYLVVGQDMFYIFSLLQGKTVKFPKTKNLKAGFNQNIRILELKAKKYKVEGVWKDVLALEVGDIIEVGNKEIVIVLPVQEILGHYYTILVQ